MSVNNIRVLKKGLTHFSGKGLVEFIETPIQAMKKPAALAAWSSPTIFEKIAHVEANAGEFSSAVSSPSTPEIVQLRRVTRAELVKNFLDFADSVEDIAKGDLPMLATTGIPFKKKPTEDHSKLLPPPSLRGRYTGASGELQAVCPADPRALKTAVRCRIEDGDWGPIFSFSNTREMILKPLVPGQPYILAARYEGRFMNSDWVVSTPIYCI